MPAECYAMIRGSAIRVTSLGQCGDVPVPTPYVVSESVAKITINEVTESASNEMLRNDDDQRRILLARSAVTIRYTVDIDFLRVDPALLGLVAAMPTVYTPFGTAGFGEMEFGIDPFGEQDDGEVVGFDAKTRMPVAAFALEVWSRLANEACPEDRRWGYTLFPFLKGGIISGFRFSNGLVSFNLRGAQTRRGSTWGHGPYDIDGTGNRLLEPVSRNLFWRQMLVSGSPPAQTDGVEEKEDVVDGGTVTMTTDDVLDGGTIVTSPYVLDGGSP